MVAKVVDFIDTKRGGRLLESAPIGFNASALGTAQSILVKGYCAAIGTNKSFGCFGKWKVFFDIVFRHSSAAPFSCIKFGNI
jgi:hypothetical protein